MDFYKQLEGPELKQPSLKDFDDVRPLGFQPMVPKQPSQQWYPIPAPDGGDAFLPFSINKPQTPQTSQRRFGSNDSGASD
jgi:hypothetical protein